MKSENRERGLFVLGRCLLASLFLLGGTAKLLLPTPYIEMMTTAGLEPARLLLPLVAVFELAGGVCIAMGWRIGAWAAFALALHTGVINLTLHAFWNLEPGAIRQLEISAFFKNVSIVGGLLIYGVGRLRYR